MNAAGCTSPAVRYCLVPQIQKSFAQYHMANCGPAVSTCQVHLLRVRRLVEPAQPGHPFFRLAAVR